MANLLKSSRLSSKTAPSVEHSRDLPNHRTGQEKSPSESVISQWIQAVLSAYTQLNDIPADGYIFVIY